MCFFSTVSTGVNSLAAIWFEELEGTEFKAKLSTRKAGYTVKILALFFGLLSFGLVFLVPFMGSLVPVRILFYQKMTEFRVRVFQSTKGIYIRIAFFSSFLIAISQALIFTSCKCCPLFQIAISLSGFFSGSLFGIFLLGIYVPFANAWVSGNYLGFFSRMWIFPSAVS